MNIEIVYRLSDNSYPQARFSYASKIYCLMNFIKHFPSSKIHLLIDKTNLQPDTAAEIYMLHDKYQFATCNIYGYQPDEECGSSAASWRTALKYALTAFSDLDYVYFVEDDYLHRKDSHTVLQEGLERSHYVSLYDHRDKYIPASQGGNGFVDDGGGEITKVIVTDSTHWKITNSTTMTFAASIQTLRADLGMWRKHTFDTSHPNDYAAFLEIRKSGKSLITPIPGYSTHCMEQWASPIIDWKLV